MRVLLLVNLLLLLYNSSNSQNHSTNFSIIVFGTYISGSTLQDNVRSPDPIKRESELELISAYGYGSEISYDPKIYNSGVRITLSSEYLSFIDSGLEYFLDNGTDQAKIKMSEEIKFLPVEFGFKWDLPVSGETFRIYIGAGAGVYFGDRIRRIGSLTSTTKNKESGFSLNISSGVDYLIARNLSVNMEFKFRDASFDVESTYPVNKVNVNNKEFEIDNPFYSRILVDGVRLSFGFKYHF